MEKNQKIKADAPLTEKELRYAKMPQTASKLLFLALALLRGRYAQTGCVLTLHYVHFLNAKFAKAGLVAEGYSYHIDYHSARLASWVN